MNGPPTIAPAPARPLRVFLHYVALAWSNGLFLLLCLMALGNFVEGDPANAQLHCALMALLPLAHSHGRGRRQSLDDAVPLDGRIDALLRVAAGTTGAACVLALCALAVGLAGSARPWWFGASWVPAGLILYLLGWAVVLRARKAGRVVMALVVAAIALRPWEIPGVAAAMLPFRDPQAAAAVPLRAWAVASAVVGVLAVATVCGAVLLERVVPRRIETAFSRLDAALDRAWGRMTSTLLRRWRRPALPGAPYRPVSLPRIAIHELATLWGRLAWPVALTALLAGRMALREMAHTTDSLLLSRGSGALVLIAGAWPALVWMGFSERREELDASAPIGRVTALVVHMMAGGVWLFFAAWIYLWGHVAGGLRAGTVGMAHILPQLGAAMISVLLVYLFGCCFAVVSTRPVRAVVAGYFACSTAYMMAFMAGLPFGTSLPPWPALDTLTRDLRHPAWAALLVSLPVYAAAAFAAAAFRAWTDRSGSFTDFIGNRKLTRRRLASLS